jgi:hypothetical protein
MLVCRLLYDVGALRPGQVSEAMARLRDAALSELDARDENSREVDGIKFDTGAHTSPIRDFNQDDNGISQYAGQNSEHIGNGPGGPIR